MAHLKRSTKEKLMRVELPVCGASELAVAKKKTEVCRASGAHFRPFDAGPEFVLSKSASVGFAFGSQRFTQQFPGIVTLFSNREKFAARLTESPESESNQSPEPTAILSPSFFGLSRDRRGSS